MMRVGETVLNVGGFLLLVREREGIRLPDDFGKFRVSPKRDLRSAWRLDAKPRGKKRRGNVLYFGERVSIDANEKRITRFHPKKRRSHGRPCLDSRFLAFAYAQILADGGGMLVHATAVVRDRRAYLFFGKSGDGKSTVAALSRRFKVIGDDVIAVRRRGKYFEAMATPWKQKTFIKTGPAYRARIRAVFFLRKSRRTAFEPMTEAQALSTLMYNHVHFMNVTEKDLMGRQFHTAADLVRTVSAFRMEFRKKKDFWPALMRSHGR